MKKYIMFLLVLSGITASLAQPFVPVYTGLPPIGRSAVAFADFDNDHDLDLVMVGLDNNAQPLGKVFLNMEGIFTETPSGISGLYNCALAVADYDLDGKMDIVATGRDENGNATRLYRNLGNGEFALTGTVFNAGGSDGDVAWGDYDNDAYPDLVISGNWDTRLYHNDGDGSFTETTAGFTIMNTPSLDWGDCDNDGDPDLLMVGDAGSVAETFIYLNENGIFTRLEVPVEGAVGGTASWGDFDNDGNLDILISGKDVSLVPVSYVYRNNGDKTFSFANAGLIGTALGPADWIDYDNDGDPDIMLAGENAGCGNASTRIYNNNGVGGFDEFQAGLPFVERASSAWGDYDNDGDFDLLLTGLSGDPVSILYRNDLLTGSFQQNTLPGIPGDLYSYVSGDYAVISWSRVTDLQSPQMAICYNVMVGSVSGGIDVVSPLSDITSGYRYAVCPGNAGNNDFMVFRSLEPGDYYFRVQALDQAFEGSPFSEEGVFTVLSTGIQEQNSNDIRVIGTGTILQTAGLTGVTAEACLISMNGKTVWSGSLTGDGNSFSLASFPPGIYLFRVKTNGSVFTAKIVR
ncbi:MAG: FG-GAP-like repeat-containing protein [Bacteroidota bacterium]